MSGWLHGSEPMPDTPWVTKKQRLDSSENWDKPKHYWPLKNKYQ